jgi:hypothetical protein
VIERIRAANAAISIYELLAERGQRVRADRPRKVFCPVHDDQHKSAQVYPEANEVFCFTCHETFDPVGLLVAEGMSYPEACKYIEDRVGIVYTRQEGPQDEFWRLLKRRAQRSGGRPITASERFSYRWAVHQTVLKLGGPDVDWSGFDEAHLDPDALDAWKGQALTVSRVSGTVGA